MSTIPNIIHKLKPICQGGVRVAQVRRNDTCSFPLHINRAIPSSRINEETKELEIGFLTTTYLECTFPAVDDLFANDWELVSQ